MKHLLQGGAPPSICSSLDHTNHDWISFQLFGKLDQEMERALKTKGHGRHNTHSQVKNTLTRTLGCRIHPKPQQKKQNKSKAKFQIEPFFARRLITVRLQIFFRNGLGIASWMTLEVTPQPGGLFL